MSERLDGPSRLDIVLDAIGFVAGIVLAGTLGWRTGDLVWGLWLSSLVIGYLSLVVGIVGADTGKVPALVSGLGKLFFVAFFTVHFGMFHFVHSVFLGLFFPVDGAASGMGPGMDGYAIVFRQCWPWLLAAAIAERRALLPGRFARTVEPAGTGDAKETAFPMHGFDPMGPYKNVIRMHLLIFFFFATFLLGIDSFAVYVVVYAVYFWPWRAFGWMPRKVG
ncbi:MAG: hypothetical protein JNK15_01200 [Planctomycetes bacterium]|nr:hypothetical protein [Planctomycetota bacterium]